MAILDILTRLQTEIGARRAGTAGEEKAQEWLMRRCEELGLPVELDDFTYIRSRFYRPLRTLFTLLWLIGCIVLSFIGNFGAGVIGIILLLFFSSPLQKRVELTLARSTSRNILAGLKRTPGEYMTAEAQTPAVLLCAHYDTPLSTPHWYRRLLNVFRALAPLSILGVIIYVVYLVLFLASSIFQQLIEAGIPAFLGRIGGLVGGVVLLFGLPYLIMLLTSSLMAIFRKPLDSPGADDNGSGTALVLEAAARLKANPPHNMDVFFAWWGAEEYGLFGSRQFVRRFAKSLNPDSLYIVNVDCVGVGERLTVHTGQGVFRKKPSDPQTVARMERLAAARNIKTIRSWESIISGGSSDHASWIDRGFTRTATILRENPGKQYWTARLIAFLLRIPDAHQMDLPHIHTLKDTLDGIRPETLAETLELTLDYIYDVDASLPPVEESLEGLSE